MAANLRVRPAFYRDRIARQDGRPQVARRFIGAAQKLVAHLLENPGRGHSARFESADLADILLVAVPGFSVFSLFYRWDGQTLSVITLEHTAQDLPSRLASILASPAE